MSLKHEMPLSMNQTKQPTSTTSEQTMKTTKSLNTTFADHLLPSLKSRHLIIVVLFTIVQAIAQVASQASQLDIGITAFIAHGATPDAVASLLSSGRNGGSWDGQGIMSSDAHAEYLSHGFEYTAVGMLFAADLVALGYTPMVEFVGAPVATNDIACIYTYAGDANLDGVIDHWDFDLFSIGQSGAGRISWLTGDFNYDNVVNADDRAIMERNYAQQGGPLGSGWTPTPVPEPSTYALVGAGVLSLFAWRRKMQ